MADDKLVESCNNDEVRARARLLSSPLHLVIAATDEHPAIYKDKNGRLMAGKGVEFCADSKT